MRALFAFGLPPLISQSNRSNRRDGGLSALRQVPDDGLARRIPTERRQKLSAE